jgi:hypothetical protein
MGRSTLSAGIPSKNSLGQTAVGPVATVLQTVRGRITTGRTARKNERIEQRWYQYRERLAAPIPGMIRLVNPRRSSRRSSEFPMGIMGPSMGRTGGKGAGATPGLSPLLLVHQPDWNATV